MNIFGVKVYTVHIKPGEPGATQQPLFIKEGINIYAMVFTVFWALYHRLWGPALLIVAFNGTMYFADKAQLLSQFSFGLIDLGFRLLVAFHANDWLRARMARDGYIMTDITAADSQLRAEQRYFERALATAA